MRQLFCGLTVVACVLWAARAEASLLSVEFVEDDQAGFDIWSTAFAGTSSVDSFTTDPVATSGTTTVTVTTSSIFDTIPNRGSLSDGTPPGFSYARLYEDILIASGPTDFLTLDFAGLNASTAYEFTLYAWDPQSSATDDKVWAVTGGTGSPSSAAVNFSDTLVDNDSFAMKFDITTTSSGTFQLQNTSGLAQSAINGFTLGPVLPYRMIEVENHSFEADENTDVDGAFSMGTGPLTDWATQSGLDSQVSVGWKDIPASELDPSPPVGTQESQALSLQSGASVLNVTDEAWSSFNVGDELSLTLSLGMRDVVASLDWNENTFFGLTDGDADFTTVEISDTIVNSGVIANNPATGTQLGDGTFVDVNIDYTITAADLLRSGNVGILIYSEGTGGSGAANQSFFDNVRLELTAAVVPEPGSAVLVALGLPFVVSATRRRRR